MVGERTEACGERKKRERRKVEKKGGEEIKEKRNIGKSGGERERSRAGRERHVEKVVPLLFFTHPPPLFKSDTLDFEANKYLSNVSRREVNEGKLGRSGKQRGAKGRERERKKKV